MSECFFLVTSNDVSKEAVELSKQHLILAANYDKSMPPIYQLLKNKCLRPECEFSETHELPNELKEDDPRLVPSYVAEASCEKTPEEITTMLS